MSAFDRQFRSSNRSDHQKSVRLGQNFLKDQRIAELLVSESTIGGSDTVYEIGPGRGIITRLLARRARKVVAIEKDPRLHASLLRSFTGCRNVVLHLADFRTFRIRERCYKVFSNIPFNMTAWTVKKLVGGVCSPQEAYLLMQRESAEKYAGVQRLNLFSVLYGPWFSFRIVRTVNCEAFRPRPCVDAAMLHIERRAEPLVPKRLFPLYRKFAKYGFSGWKPNLGRTYRMIFTCRQWRRLAGDLGFNRNATATELTRQQWMGLFHYFMEGVSDEKKALV